MRILLQTDAGTVGLVNAAVVVLVIIFLTLPTVFVLAEYIRRRRRDGDTRVYTSESSALFMGPAAPPTAMAETADTEGPRDRKRAQGIRVVRASDVEHDFTREPVPPEIGFLEPESIVDGPVVFSGHLQVGRRCTIKGDVEASGSLALAEGAYVVGEVTVHGNLYLGSGARVKGRAAAGGNGFLSAWSRVLDLHADGTVELEDGARVEGLLEAGRVVKVDTVHDERARSRSRQTEDVVEAVPSEDSTVDDKGRRAREPGVITRRQHSGRSRSASTSGDPDGSAD